ncbi:MAG: hypothetical protein NUV54_02300, partial [Candidatus Taylorbacteria bacterium]|nr:hypothetical protein [Candidatus Taylorbacteria bacterium]
MIPFGLTTTDAVFLSVNVFREYTEFCSTTGAVSATFSGAFDYLIPARWLLAFFQDFSHTEPPFLIDS